MRELFVQLMSDYGRELIFIHILSAILWVGGMIVLRLAVTPSIKSIEDGSIRIARSLEIMKRFFSIVMVVSLLMLVSAIIFIIGLNLKNAGDIYQVVIIKEAIWIIMFGVFLFIYFKRNQAQRYFVSGDIQGAKHNIFLIEKLILANIVFGLVAVYLGVILRGY